MPYSSFIEEVTLSASPLEIPALGHSLPLISGLISYEELSVHLGLSLVEGVEVESTPASLLARGWDGFT